MKGAILTLACEPGKKTWVAHISGRSKKFGFKREFLGSYGGKAGGKAEYVLEEGLLYEVCECDTRRFVKWVDGGVVEVSREDVIGAFLDKAAKARKAAEARAAKAQAMTDEIDSRIARFNSEGGFTLN